MAEKGQKFNKYSQEIKNKIYKELLDGKSYNELARKYDINPKTISTWQQKLRHPDKYLGHGKKRGKPKGTNLTKEDWKERYEIIKKYQAFLKAQREKK